MSRERKVSVTTTFSERLENARKRQGLTQLQLAERANISRSAISGYLTQGKTASYEVLVQLANTLGVTTDYLIGVDDDSGWTPREHVAEAFVSLEIPYERATDEKKALMDAAFREIAKLLNFMFDCEDTTQLNAIMDMITALRRMTAGRDADGE